MIQLETACTKPKKKQHCEVRLLHANTGSSSQGIKQQSHVTSLKDTPPHHTSKIVSSQVLTGKQRSQLRSDELMNNRVHVNVLCLVWTHQGYTKEQKSDSHMLHITEACFPCFSSHRMSWDKILVMPEFCCSITYVKTF